MTKLVLSAANSQLLKQVAQTADAVQSLKAAFADQPDQRLMTTHSPAVPSTSSKDTPNSVVLDHKVLITIASWASNINPSAQPSLDLEKLRLSSLVRGSQVYIPPKPVFQRSEELEQSLAAIRRAQEEAEYQRMSSTTTSNTSGAYRIPSSYTNIAGVDRSLSLTQRIHAQTGSPQQPNSLLGEGEEQAWKDAQRLLSVILNIFLSTMATATAAWWASGNASAGHKVLVSMLVAVVTAVAEIILYIRYSVYVKESKKIKDNRMKGSDVKKGLPRFKPLQLDRAGAKATSTRTKSAQEEKPS
ncbi:hypothetical protein NDA14_005240 [Ustilago hordei]|nr:hypothetical protein NDA14_005240 [Ustilago hordei]UTT88631.1 hypothetical protein NDA17_002921 [Ustilago hordei]